jgi:hypothetical protein
MSNQEYREQTQGLDKFHDKHSSQVPPDWLKAEAEAETVGKTYVYDLGHHTVELNEQGTLVLHESETRMALSADEAYKLLVWLHDNHRATLHQLAHGTDEPKP